MARYRQLVLQVSQQIAQGLLKSGEKLPSLRLFARQHGVSMTTAIRCYEQLEAQGYLYVKAKSGFYVCGAEQGASVLEFEQFKPQVASLSPQTFGDVGLLDNRLSTAQLAPELMPLKSLNRCIKQAVNQAGEHAVQYGSAMGSETLRQALVTHFQQNGLSLATERLLISAGCIHSVTLALESVTEIGDTVAVSSPCYQGLLRVLRLLKRRVIEIPSTSEGLDLAHIQTLAAQGEIQACLLSANQQNPTGHGLSVAQKQQLAQMAAQYRLPIIEDDVFAELRHQGPMALPIKAWDSGGYVIWCSSVSKTLAPGLRIGWCEAGRYTGLLAERLAATTMGLNQLMQEALAGLINSGHYRRHLHHINQTLALQMAAYREFLQNGLPQDCQISAPKGGLVLWLKLPEIDTKSLAEQARDAGFELRAGHLFTTRDLYHHHLRLNIGWPLSEVKPLLLKLFDFIDKTKVC